MLTTAVEGGHISANPCTIKGAGIELALERPIPTVGQARQVAEVIEPRMRVAVLLEAFVGLRKGELLGLQRSDIDLDRNEITIGRQPSSIATAPSSLAHPGPTPDDEL